MGISFLPATLILQVSRFSAVAVLFMVISLLLLCSGATPKLPVNGYPTEHPHNKVYLQYKSSSSCVYVMIAKYMYPLVYPLSHLAQAL